MSARRATKAERTQTARGLAAKALSEARQDVLRYPNSYTSLYAALHYQEDMLARWSAEALNRGDTTWARECAEAYGLLRVRSARIAYSKRVAA